MLRILADEREKPSGVPDELHELGAAVDYRVLDVADYVVGEFGIERKSTRDFMSSLFNGRLFDQAYRIGEAYEKAILIVEGDLEQQMKKLKNTRSLWGGLISAVLDFHLSCFFTPDPRQTAEFIITLARGGRYKGGPRPPSRIGRKPKVGDLKRVQASIVSSLPGIGPRMAEQLLASFGSVRKTFAASTTEMAIGARIGKARALTLNRILDEPYKASKTIPSQLQLH